MSVTDALRSPFFYGAMILAMLIAGIFFVMLPDREKQVRARLAAIKAPVAETENKKSLLTNEQINIIGNWLAATPLVGKNEQLKMVARLAAAGIVGGDKIAIFVSAKALSGILVAIIGGFTLAYIDFWPSDLNFEMVYSIALLLGGWRLPDMVVARWAATRTQKLADGFADALDLLVICVEAGLALEQAMERVSRDIAQANPVVSEELAKTVAEMQILPQVRDALDNFSTRSGLAEVRSVMTTLIQTVQYGTPLAASLRVLSADMRAHRMLRMEESAARLPVLLTLPLILFILPALFMIIGGPAYLTIMDTIKK